MSRVDERRFVHAYETKDRAKIRLNELSDVIAVPLSYMPPDAVRNVVFLPISNPANASTEVWIPARQFTGRVVSVSNSMIFAQPVYN